MCAKHPMEQGVLLSEVLPPLSPAGSPLEAQFRSLMDSLESCTAITDASGRIVATNGPWDSFPGHSPFITGIAVGTDFQELCQAFSTCEDGGVARVAQGILSVLQGEIPRLRLDYPLRFGGKLFWYGLVVSRMPLEPNQGIVIHNVNITPRKEAELEKARMEVQLRHSQKMEAIGQLAAGIAHEISTPTQYISDNLRFLGEAFIQMAEALKREGEFLEESAAAPRVRALLDQRQEQDLPFLLAETPTALQQSVEGLSRVTAIVRAMKAFSHPGTEGRSTVDLNKAIETTLLVARNEWKYVAELETDFDPTLPPVECYPGEINQVFLNLVVNAAQAIEEAVRDSGRRGLIRIATRAVEGFVEVRITDTGAGIPVEIQSQIFLPFFTTKPVGKGTGQGLSIAHSVINRHGGTIAFESTLGEGTCFTVRIPLAGSARKQ